MTLENENNNIKKGQLVGFNPSALKAIGVKESTVLEGGALTKQNGLVEEEVETISALEGLEQFDFGEPTAPATEPEVPGVITTDPVEIAPIDALTSLITDSPKEEAKEEVVDKPVIPDLQIQMPVMDEQVLATEPQGINEGLFGDQKVETKFEEPTVPVAEQTPVAEPAPVVEPSPEVQAPTGLNEFQIPNLSVPTLDPTPSVNLNMLEEVDKKIDEFTKDMQERTEKFKNDLKTYLKNMGEIEKTNAQEPENKTTELDSLPSMDAFVDPTSLINGIPNAGPRL